MTGHSELEKFVCVSCGYIYDPSKGDPEHGVKPGTGFDDVPENWHCPICYSGKDSFDLI